MIDGDMLPPLSLLLLQKMACSTGIALIRLSAAEGVFTAEVEDVPTPLAEDETVI